MEKVCRRRSDGEDLTEKVRWRRFAEKGPTKKQRRYDGEASMEKILRRRSDGEDPTEKVGRRRSDKEGPLEKIYQRRPVGEGLPEKMTHSITNYGFDSM